MFLQKIYSSNDKKNANTCDNFTIRALGQNSNNCSYSVTSLIISRNEKNVFHYEREIVLLKQGCEIKKKKKTPQD